MTEGGALKTVRSQAEPGNEGTRERGKLVSYPGSAWVRTALEAPPPGSLSYHPSQARSSATDEANSGLKHHAA